MLKHVHEGGRGYRTESSEPIAGQIPRVGVPKGGHEAGDGCCTKALEFLYCRGRRLAVTNRQAQELNHTMGVRAAFGNRCQTLSLVVVDSRGAEDDPVYLLCVGTGSVSGQRS